MSVRTRGGLLDPLVDYQLTLRRDLTAFDRAIALNEAIVWAARGLCLGLVVDLAMLVARWLAAPPWLQLSGPALLAVPLLAGLAAGVLAAARPRPLHAIARRLDARLGLAERTLTALEAPQRSEEASPLHLWQLRDAVERVHRSDPLEAFPIEPPRRELLTTLLLAIAATLLWLLPSPVRGGTPLLDARGQLVREEAERLTGVAEAMAEDSSLQSEALEQIRQMLRQAAQQLEQHIDAPGQAAASLEEIERQLQTMAYTDQELATALATVASALAGTPETRDLSLSLRSGDLKEVARATRDLARQVEGMSPSARARAGQALRSAALQASERNAALSQLLGQAADALDPAGAASGEAQSLSSQEALTQAQNALRQLAELSAAAAARQRAEAALQGARHALSRGQPMDEASPSGGASGDQAQGQSRQGLGSGARSSDETGEDGESGSGFGTGTQANAGASPRLDVITRPEQLHTGRSMVPDELAEAPLLQPAGQNEAQVSEEAVQPWFDSRPSGEAGLDASIPLGLRELVKEYFSTRQEAQP